MQNAISFSDLLQFGKTCEHFFHTDFVKIYRYLVIPAAFYNILHDTNSEFHMAHGITDSVIQLRCLGNGEILLLKACFAWKFIFIWA